MKIYTGYISILIMVLMACASNIVVPETGSLDINVTIGPLCPVEPCNKTAAELKQVYESYSFVLSNSKDKSIVLEQNLTYNGTKGTLKSTNIAVGEYELTIKPENFFTKRGFPKTVTIEKNKVTTLEIDIDTGLR
jgi:hypothetical protein